MRSRVEAAASAPTAQRPLTTYDAMQEDGLTMPQSATVQSYYVASPGAMIGDSLVLPTGLLEVGGELVFVTSDRKLAGAPVELTDLGLLRLRARRAVAQRLELYAATELVAKQPHGLDAPLFQGVLGGARFAATEHLAAVVSGGGGPLLGRDGHHFELGSHLQYRAKLDRYVRLDVELGTATTRLAYRPRPTTPFYLEEVFSRLAALFGDDDGGGWIALDYRLPFAWGPRTPTFDGQGSSELDPGPGLGLEVGGVLSLEERGWDLFAVLAWLDRGQEELPETTLPILHGGFDAVELSLGLQHRFEVVPDPERQLRRLERRQLRRTSRSP